jgi:hypothetical protein
VITIYYINNLFAIVYFLEQILENFDFISFYYINITNLNKIIYFRVLTTFYRKYGYALKDLRVYSSLQLHALIRILHIEFIRIHSYSQMRKCVNAFYI